MTRTRVVDRIREVGLVPVVRAHVIRAGASALGVGADLCDVAAIFLLSVEAGLRPPREASARLSGAFGEGG